MSRFLLLMEVVCLSISVSIFLCFFLVVSYSLVWMYWCTVVSQLVWLKMNVISGRRFLLFSWVMMFGRCGG